MILLLFFCSGATALIYEVIWSKYLTLLFGSTIEAQTVVLAVFMGGLALGNKLFSRYADRAFRPLVIYGRIEISVGIYSLLFPFFYVGAGGIFAAVGARMLDHPNWLLLLKGLISVTLLLLPTLLLGGTLPVLAAWLQKNTSDAGRRSARFYSTNSLGAVCGAALAGFLLVQTFGLRMTMEMAALANVLIGFVALAIAKKQISSTTNQDSGAARPVSNESTGAMFHWSCILVALTGAVSMSLEVLASRCLALIFGASVQVFAIVLMAFILGIGLGSAVIASPRWKHWPKEIVTMALLLGAAAAIGLVVFDIERLAEIYVYAQSGLSRTAIGYWYHQIFTSAIAIGLLGLPAAALGAVLPLWIRAASETSDLLGNRVGRLLTWNTLGAVVGVLVTGFVLMPHIGLRGSFAVFGFVLAGAVIFIGVATRRPVIGASGLVCAVLLGFVSMNGAQDWRNILSSGVFRLPEMDFSQKVSPWKSYLDNRRNFASLLFYEDGADATVSVEKEISQDASPDEIILSINGKSDASAFSDRSTQILLAQLPLMIRPDSKEVFCFGMGSGITAGSALGYPIEHLTIAENCEPVLRAARLFSQWNHGVFTNDRVRIYHEDARTVLKLGPQKYDVIISEPSNPWTVGIGSVYTREFYQLAANRLQPGGIMTQWFHLYEMDDQILDVVLRTFHSVFPNMEIWDVGNQDIILLGSDQPWKTGPDIYQQAFALEQPRSDLASIGLVSPQAVLARQFASQATAFAIAGPGPVQSDDLPILEYDAPGAFYMFLDRFGIQDFQNYDERTWQMGLASVAKDNVLAQLTLKDLATIFYNSAGSGNFQFMSYLRNRFQGQHVSLTFGNSVMPCVFKDPDAKILVYAAPSAQTNMIPRQLYFDEVALLRDDPLKKSEAVDSIKSILDSVQNYQPQTADWSAAHYADLAVKECLRKGDTTLARAILSRGLQLEPDSEQLKYLSRVIAAD
jgi:spermidine synthase